MCSLLPRWPGKDVQNACWRCAALHPCLLCTSLTLTLTLTPAGVEHLELTSCSLKGFPAAAVLSAPLLHTLSLAGNCSLVLTRAGIKVLGMVPCLRVLVSRLARL